jgi:hypothetical protein
MLNLMRAAVADFALVVAGLLALALIANALWPL